MMVGTLPGAQRCPFGSLDRLLVLDVDDGMAPTPKGTYVVEMKLKDIFVRPTRTKARKTTAGHRGFECPTYSVVRIARTKALVSFVVPTRGHIPSRRVNVPPSQHTNPRRRR
jgi:hypothetical protein